GRKMAAEVVESDQVAGAVRALIHSKGAWNGTPAELLEELRPEHPGRGWPADATRLSGRLRRAAPALRTVGVDVELFKTNGHRVVQIRRIADRDAEGVGQGRYRDAGRDAESASDPVEGAGQTRFPSFRDAADAKGPSSPFGTPPGKGSGEAPDGEEASRASSASIATLTPE
ncbi:MAG: hypothetical protein M3450_08915, partial [Actinomycetota bacterium]|nr:hypothetical protein [Actinomycetota bacterium]